MPSNHLMALARTSTTFLTKNNANNVSHDNRIKRNVTNCPPSFTPMSQSSLFQNTTQTVQVNEFIENITRNTTNNVSQSFSLLSTNSLDDDDEPSLLDESEFFPFMIGTIWTWHQFMMP